MEKSKTYGVVYLNKIEKINNCNYTIRLFKVIDEGNLQDLGSSNVAHTVITRVENNIYYFKSTLPDTGFVLEDKLVKKSNEISDEFKSIIKAEEKDNN